jgi:hypothetical protein
MFLWIYNLPNWLLFTTITGASVGVCWALLFLLRPAMKRWSGHSGEGQHNNMVNLVAAGTGLLYSLLLGLVAVATYGTYADNQKIVDNEANALGGLYRDVSFYPQPLRDKAEGALKDYVQYVINDAWPQQEHGEIPSGGTDRITVIYTLMASYEPPTPGREVLQTAAINQFGTFVDAYRQRLTAVQSSLPGPLWIALIVGALINLAVIVMSTVRKLATHMVLLGLFAFIFGMVIYLIAALDNSFRGALGIDPTSYEIVRDQVMSHF